MDLEKAYDRVDRKALWSVLYICGVGGQLSKGVGEQELQSDIAVFILNLTPALVFHNILFYMQISFLICY